MREFTLRIFEQELRLLEGDNPASLRTRPLAADDLARLIEQVEGAYRPALLTPVTLVELGKALAAWLDGPADQWLDFLLSQQQPITLRIDVDGRLRHLPWELLYRDGFLCQRSTGALNVVRLASPRTSTPERKNRPLQVLLMASSPEGARMLDFEEEEAKILRATQTQPIELVIEESGSLDGLKDRVASHDVGHFDVLHLTGHASVLQDSTPVFLAEDTFGRAAPATAEQLADALGSRWPRLLFVSACSTGQAQEQGQLPSLCEALVRHGAPAVLGWALPVDDVSASVAAAKLYGLLATGEDLHSAFALTRKELLEQRSPSWHLLQAYSDASQLTALVRPLNTPGRQRLRVRPAHSDFLDANGKTRVCSRKDFVGRRRPIQRCLRRLQPSESEVQGVLLHGLGGLGKSSLAARLSERLPRLERIVLVGNVDEASLIQAICDKLPRATSFLQGPGVQGWSLTARLQELLRTEGNPPILLVFDDFEHTFDKDNPGAGPNGVARNILEACLRAIRETGSESRVMVTCRFTFALHLPLALHTESLESLQGAEQLKKVARLDELPGQTPTKELPANIRERALRVGAGNPRLMERLWALLGAAPSETDALLEQMEKAAEQYREGILLGKLLEQAGPGGQDLLARAAIFELAVERGALGAVAPDAGEIELERVISLGLLEAGAEHAGAESPAHYRVPDLLRPLLQGKLNEEVLAEATRAALRFLHETWWENQSDKKQAQVGEIHRLALKAKAQTIAAELAVVLAQGWMAEGLLREARILCEKTLKVAEDAHHVLHLLAVTEHHLGDTSEALKHFQQSLDACPCDDDSRQIRAATLRELARVRLQKGDAEEAMALLQQALDLQECIDDVPGKAATLDQVAVIRARQGKMKEAMDLLQQSFSLKDRVGDDWGKATTLHEMALVFAQQGKDEAAMALWKQSLDLKDRNGDILGTAATLNQMAVVRLRQWKTEEAMALLQKSLGLEVRTGNVKGKATALGHMAQVRLQQGKGEEAMRLLQQALDLYEHINDAKNKAAIMKNMADIWYQKGNSEEAMRLLQQALDIQEGIGEAKGKADTLSSMAAVRLQEGKEKEAMTLWQGAFDINESIGNIQGKAIVLQNMAVALSKKGDTRLARQRYKEAAVLLASAKAWPDLATVLLNMGLEQGPETLPFLLQACWLALWGVVPAETGLNALGNVFQGLGMGHPSAPSLGVAAMVLVERQGSNHPNQEMIRQRAFLLLEASAFARGVNHKDLEGWLDRAGLRDASKVLPSLRSTLEAMVPDDAWLFDRTQVQGSPVES